MMGDTSGMRRAKRTARGLDDSVSNIYYTQPSIEHCKWNERAIPLFDVGKSITKQSAFGVIFHKRVQWHMSVSVRRIYVFLHV